MLQRRKANWWQRRKSNIANQKFTPRKQNGNDRRTANGLPQFQFLADKCTGCVSNSLCEHLKFNSLPQMSTVCKGIRTKSALWSYLWYLIRLGTELWTQDMLLCFVRYCCQYLSDSLGSRGSRHSTHKPLLGKYKYAWVLLHKLLFLVELFLYFSQNTVCSRGTRGNTTLCGWGHFFTHLIQSTRKWRLQRWAMVEGAKTEQFWRKKLNPLPLAIRSVVSVRLQMPAIFCVWNIWQSLVLLLSWTGCHAVNAQNCQPEWPYYVHNFAENV